MKRATAVAIVALVVSGACGSSATRAQAPRADVLAIGDSLLHESAAALRAGLRGRRVVIRAISGGALCDVGRKLPADLTRYRPRLVVVESVANGLTPCISGAGRLGDPSFTRQYRRDLRKIVTRSRAAGAQVLVVGPPPLGGLTAGGDQPLAALARHWRDDERGVSGVRFTTGPRDAVSDHGRYRATKPCDGSERTRSECRGGLIVIRDDYFGVHFCPVGYSNASEIRRGCPVYSSGALRFGRAIARAVRAR